MEGDCKRKLWLLSMVMKQRWEYWRSVILKPMEIDASTLPWLKSIRTCFVELQTKQVLMLIILNYSEKPLSFFPTWSQPRWQKGLICTRDNDNEGRRGRKSRICTREPRDLSRLYDDFFWTCNIIRQCFNNGCNYYRPIGTEWYILPIPQHTKNNRHQAIISHHKQVKQLLKSICDIFHSVIVFHRVHQDLYSPEPAIPTILNQWASEEACR